MQRLSSAWLNRPEGGRGFAWTAIFAMGATLLGEVVLAGAWRYFLPVLSPPLGYILMAVLVLLFAAIPFVTASVFRSASSAQAIRTAQAALSACRRGEYRIPSPETNDDSRVLLTEAFNSLLGELERRDQQLEQQVRSRTLELEGAIGQLGAAKERAELADKLKGEFLAKVSHELRTPLNVILGMTSLVLESRLEPEQRKHLRMAMNSGEDLLRLLNDILDLSKVESGRIELQMQRLRVPAVVREALEPHRRPAEKKGLRLTCEIHPAVPEWLLGDPNRLRQILSNLVENAVKFTEVGGVHVHVEVDFQTVSAVSLHFSVIDTGIGIEAEEQNRIFEAFVQADGTAGRQYGGSGLGLAICKQLVERMNGRLWVESSPDEGSRFHFTSVFETAHSSHDAPPKVERGEHHQTVLVVSPRNEIRSHFGSAFDGLGYPTAIMDEPSSALTLLPIFARAKRHIGAAFVDEDVLRTPEGAALRSALDSTPVAVITASRLGRTGAEQSHWLRVPRRPSAEDLYSVLLDLEAEDQERRNPTWEVLPSFRILIVDDRQENRSLLDAVLSRRGHHCSQAASGTEAIERLSQEEVDLLLLDIEMPGMSGIEVITRLREAERQWGRRLPVIGVTAHAMHGDRERYLAAGLDDYVAKPVKIEDLLAAMRRVLPICA